MAHKLIVIGGKHAGMEIPISAPRCVIGRGGDCNIRPQSQSVSRWHCEILYRDDGTIAIVDCGSVNGTFINGKKVERQHLLKTADRIKIGPFEFQVRLAANEEHAPSLETQTILAGANAQSLDVAKRGSGMPRKPRAADASEGYANAIASDALQNDELDLLGWLDGGSCGIAPKVVSQAVKTRSPASGQPTHRQSPGAVVEVKAHSAQRGGKPDALKADSLKRLDDVGIAYAERSAADQAAADLLADVGEFFDDSLRQSANAAGLIEDGVHAAQRNIVPKKNSVRAKPVVAAKQRVAAIAEVAISAASPMPHAQSCPAVVASGRVKGRWAQEVGEDATKNQAKSIDNNLAQNILAAEAISTPCKAKSLASVADHKNSRTLDVFDALLIATIVPLVLVLSFSLPAFGAGRRIGTFLFRSPISAVLGLLIFVATAIWFCVRKPPREKCSAASAQAAVTRQRRFPQGIDWTLLGIGAAILIICNIMPRWFPNYWRYYLIMLDIRLWPSGKFLLLATALAESMWLIRLWPRQSTQNQSETKPPYSHRILELLRRRNKVPIRHDGDATHDCTNRKSNSQQLLSSMG